MMTRRALWSIAKVEKVLLSKDNEVRDATIKYVIYGKAVVINRLINKLYPIEPMKQTSADIQTKFVDDTKVFQTETTQDTLICYTVIIYMYMCIGLVVPRRVDVMFDHIVFAFAGTSVQASPRGWKKYV